MRKTVVSLAAAATMLSAAALAPSGANAMTPGAAAGLRAAIEDSSLLEEAAYVCRHRWRSSRRVCWWSGPAVYFHPYPRYRHRHRHWRRW